MLTVNLPCPTCATPLILDGENAGQEVLCPGCQSRLRLPSKVAAAQVPELLAPPPSAGANSGKRLPSHRSKSVDEERKRLAAAAAAGGAHQIDPEAAALPADHHRTVLPHKRNVEDPSPLAPLDPAAPNPTRKPASLPTRRTMETAVDQHRPARPMEPIEVKPDAEFNVTPLQGPSRFVRPDSKAPPAVPADPEPAPEVDSDKSDSESANVPRGGFRLGEGREPHFMPAAEIAPQIEAPNWGARSESPKESGRSRGMMTLALLIVLIAAGSTGIYMMREAFQAPQAVEMAEDASDSESAVQRENVMRNVEDARRVLERFFAAETTEQLAAEVRHPDITLPRIQRFYAEEAVRPRKVRSYGQSWSEVQIGGIEFIRGSLELDDFLLHQVNLEIVPGSDPKLDWESFVSWAELPWKEFLRNPPAEPHEYRVTVIYDRRDQYYNYSFENRELDTLCFKLEDPAKFGTCWAYCDKDSEAASLMLFHLKRARQQGSRNEQGKLAMTCILRLRFPPEGMKTNQVVIDKFVHDSWVLP